MGMADPLWDNPTASWEDEAARRVVQLFAVAFPEAAAVAALVRPLGLTVAMPVPTAFGAVRDTLPGSPIHDVWRAVLAQASARYRARDVAAVALEAADPVWRPMFVRVLGPIAEEVEVVRLRRFGALAEPRSSALDAGGPEPVVEPSPGGCAGGAGLEAWDPGAMPPVANEDVRVNEALAGRRLAVVDYLGNVAGSGCLVGPDLLLTAAHVVEGRDPRDLVVYFDHGRANLASGEELDRVDVTSIEAISPPAQSEIDRKAAAWEGIELRTLDAAILRLARPVGIEVPPGERGSRGFYRLLLQPVALAGGPRLTVYHHGAGLRLLQSDTEPQLLLNKPGSRLRYRATTLPGSSGGAILHTASGRLVAMHTGSVVVSAAANDTRGQAIPIWQIAAWLRAEHPELLETRAPGTVLAPQETPEQVRRRLLGSLQIAKRPFVDRSELRSLIDGACATSGSRTMVVLGDRNSGVSMSYALLSHLAAEVPAISAVRIDLRLYRSLDDPAERLIWVLREIVEQIAADEGDGGVNAAEPIWAHSPERQPARDLLAFRAYCVRRFRRAERQWWLFFDSIDDVAHLSGGLDELVKLLLDLARDLQFDLRIVLAGRAVGRLPPEFVGGAVIDTIGALTRDDCIAWLRSCASADGRTIDDALVDERLDKLFPPGGPAPPVDQVQLRLPALFEEVVA